MTFKSVITCIFYFTYGILAYSFYLNEIKPLSKGDSTIPPVVVIKSTTDSVKNNSPLDTGATVQSIIEQKLDTTKINCCISLFKNGCEVYQESQLPRYEYFSAIKEMAPLVYQNFSFRQIQTVDHINLIAWENLNDNILGITHSVENEDSYIDLAYYHDKRIYTLYHEIWHSIHNHHFTYFETHLQSEWEKIDVFVSDYAKTNITEDIAETGAAYTAGDTLPYNPKFMLIKKFFNYTK